MSTLFSLLMAVASVSSHASEGTLDNASCLILNTSMGALVCSVLLQERLVNSLSTREGTKPGKEVACLLCYALLA